MGLDRDTLKQLAHLLRPHATRVANLVARAVVQLADDSTKLQLLQLGVLAGETIDGAEHFHPYGFTSVPLAGAEAVVAFPNGDRSHPLVVATSDRRYRPTGGEPGQVTLYHYRGGSATFLHSGDVVIQPGTGGKVIVTDGAGGEGPVVTQAQFLNHTHLTAATGPAVPPTAISVSPALVGTAVLQAK